MGCGAPVIASNTTSLPEVIGREDALFDPESPDDIIRSHGRALGDEGILEDLRRHGLEARQAVQLGQDGAQDAGSLRGNFTTNGTTSGRQSVATDTRPAAAARVSHSFPRCRPMRPRFPASAGNSDEAVPPLRCRVRRLGRTGSTASRPDRLARSARPNGSPATAPTSTASSMPGRPSGLPYLDARTCSGGGPARCLLHDSPYRRLAARCCRTPMKQPSAWLRELYRSHGWTAVSEYRKSRDKAEFIDSYPCAGSIIRAATGVIDAAVSGEGQGDSDAPAGRDATGGARDRKACVGHPAPARWTGWPTISSRSIRRSGRRPPTGTRCCAAPRKICRPATVSASYDRRVGTGAARCRDRHPAGDQEHHDRSAWKIRLPVSGSSRCMTTAAGLCATPTVWRRS